MRSVFYIVFIFAFIGCEKENVIPEQPFIHTGENNGSLIIYHENAPYDTAAFVYPSTYTEFDYDITGDALADFKIIANMYVNAEQQHYSYTVSGYRKDIQFCVNESLSSYADTLARGQLINNNMNWHDTIAVLNSYTLTMQQQEPGGGTGIGTGGQMGQYSLKSGYLQSGCWNNAGEKYLAFRICTSTDTLYGWLRAEIINHTQLIIKDYASIIPKR